MNRFSTLLKELNSKLDLPQPLKSKILIEVSEDLNDLYAHYIEKGFSKHEAIKMATEKINLTDETIAELVNIHKTTFHKWFQRLSERTRNRWEKVSLILILALLLFFTSGIIFSEEFFLQASVFMLPVIGLFICTLALSAIKFFKIYIQKDHNISRLRNKLPSILFLGGATLLVGFIGYFIDMYLTVSKIIAEFENFLMHFVQWLVRSSAHLMITFVITIIIFVIWYIFYNKVLKIEEASAAHLINE